ncbi:MAG: HAD family hydrolase [Candidatus Brocadiaceae bacterium]|nr:HAD family hydrolase [Candidatus Brocadiaceae bacterium]
MAFQGVLTDEQIAQDPQQQVRQWQRKRDFAICIDTDGCTLDNMWAKQVVVFHPHFMDFNGLRGIEMFFRLHAEHHNLWGKTRGCDRYLAVRHTLASLLDDPQATEAMPVDHVRDLLASVQRYVDFIDASGGRWGFGIPSLRHFHEQNGLDYNITRLLGWSEAVDRTFPFVTLGMAPFAGVRETLEYLSAKADILVVSATPYRDLAQWWTRTGLADYVGAIAGKEMGKKNEHIRLLKEAGGYGDDQVIMVGDGGGDLKAAQANNAMFYPTPAGKEQEAWQNAREAFDAFFEGRYCGAMEDEKVAEFQNILLEKGPWQLPGYDARQAYRELQDKRAATYRELHPDGTLLTV